MQKLNFQPAKSKENFRKNYQLHDLAEYHGKNLFLQWGVDFKDYGKDRRYERVWEKGEDKPDIVAEYKNIQFLIDWKGKAKEAFWVNERAIKSYETWSKELNLHVVVAFFIFDKKGFLKDRRFAILSKHNYLVSEEKAWDKNKVIKFQTDLPKFNKHNLLWLLNNNNQ